MSDTAQDGRSARAQRRREETRAAILEAARQVFRTRGYHQASVADIVAQAHVARGTFYLYFQNKQDVLQFLMQDFVDQIRACVQRIATDPGSPAPIDQVRANFHRILTCIEDNEDVAAVMFSGEMAVDEESRRRVDALWAQVEGMIQDALRVGQGLGLVRACNRPATAVMALGAVRTVLGRQLHERNQDNASLPDTDELLEELIAFILRGILRPPGQSAR